MLGLWLAWSFHEADLFKVGVKCSPIVELQLLGGGYIARRWVADECFCPIVGLADNIELRRVVGAADAPELDFEAKEIDILAGDVVEPIERGAVSSVIRAAIQTIVTALSPAA